MFRSIFRHRVLRNNVMLPCRNFKSDLKIKWVRPVKIPCIDPRKSGDLKSLPSLNMKELAPYMSNSQELKSSSDLVKRLLSLEFSPRRESMSVIQKSMVSSVRRHVYDDRSFESRIARMTAIIRNFQELYSKNPGDKRLKVHLKELIDKRKKYLKFLRRSDYKRFEWVLEKLDLQYRPPPSHFHWITRKESLQKLTDKYCADLKEERLKAYQAKLEDKKVAFLTEKVDKLKWIIAEEKECGITPSVTQDDVDKVVRQLEELKMQKEDDIKQKADKNDEYN